MENEKTGHATEQQRNATASEHDGKNNRSGATIPVTAVDRNDVVLGRESLNAWQQGTCSLINHIEQRLEEYFQSSSRTAKSDIVNQVYQQARGRGRFLTRQEDGEGYIELDEKTSKTKISHMFRYRKRRTRSAPTDFPVYTDTRPATNSSIACSPPPLSNLSEMLETTIANDPIHLPQVEDRIIRSQQRNQAFCAPSTCTASTERLGGELSTQFPIDAFSLQGSKTNHEYSSFGCASPQSLLERDTGISRDDNDMLLFALQDSSPDQSVGSRDTPNYSTGLIDSQELQSVLSGIDWIFPPAEFFDWDLS